MNFTGVLCVSFRIEAEEQRRRPGQIGRPGRGSEGEIFYIVRAELRAYPPSEAAERRRRPQEQSGRRDRKKIY